MFVFYSVVVGMGELDVSGERDTSNDSTPPPVCPYLLLDVRDKEDFDQCHIVTGKYGQCVVYVYVVQVHVARSLVSLQLMSQECCGICKLRNSHLYTCSAAEHESRPWKNNCLL